MAVLFTMAVACFATVGPAHAQVMVVKAEGPSAGAFPAGALIPASRTLLLKAGDHLTLLDGAGTRDFTGPGVFHPRQPPAEARSALGALLDRNRRDAARQVGAVRGGPDTSGAPESLWQFDLASASGGVCVPAGQQISLWRPYAGASRLDIVRLADNSRRRLVWPAGAGPLPWPADLPMQEGDEYLLTTTDGLEATMVVHVVDAPSGDWSAFAGRLIDLECDGQVAILEASLRGDTTAETLVSP